jgi:4-carboxymuconolactone decarboxylase
VNLLLFLLWQATRGARMTTAEVAEIERRVGAWRDMTVIPLRSLRRALKSPPPLVAGATAELFRTKVKAVELEAERLQQEAMYELAGAMPWGQEALSLADAARGNIAAYEAMGGKAFPKPAIETLLAALPGVRAHNGGMTMDKEVHDRGLAMRRKVLGEEYVDRALKSADDFNRDFQRIVTQYCWGEAWGDDYAQPARALDPQSRHDRLARQDGGIPDPCARRAAQRADAERDPRGAHADRGLLRIPVGVDCFRLAKAVLSEARSPDRRGPRGFHFVTVTGVTH